MKLRKTLAAAGALAIAGSMLAVQPSSAQVSNDGTTVTFQLDGAAALAITTPADPATVVGSVTALSQVTANLGATTVTDNTGSLLGWQVTASAVDLENADASASIPKLNLSWSTSNLAGGATAGPLVINDPITGDPVDVVYEGTGGPFGATDPIVAVAAPLYGGGSYTYDGAVTLTVPANTLADTYSTVITQTVS